GGRVDVLAFQGAGASWFPASYRYPPARHAELARSKRLAKLAYVERTLRLVAPLAALPFAGPPCFLDPDLFHHNREMEGGIFPDQRDVADWLAARGLPNVIVLLPGDAWDVEARVRQPHRASADFSFLARREYLAASAARHRRGRPRPPSRAAGAALGAVSRVLPPPPRAEPVLQPQDRDVRRLRNPRAGRRAVGRRFPAALARGACRHARGLRLRLPLRLALAPAHPRRRRPLGGLLPLAALRGAARPRSVQRPPARAPQVHRRTRPAGGRGVRDGAPVSGAVRGARRGQDVPRRPLLPARRQRPARDRGGVAGRCAALPRPPLRVRPDHGAMPQRPVPAARGDRAQRPPASPHPLALPRHGSPSTGHQRNPPSRSSQ